MLQPSALLAVLINISLSGREHHLCVMVTLKPEDTRSFKKEADYIHGYDFKNVLFNTDGISA